MDLRAGSPAVERRTWSRSLRGPILAGPSPSCAHLNDIALGNLVDAPAGPGLANLPAKEPSDLAPGTVLRQTLRYEGLQQIFDPVCHDTSPRRSLLGRRIAALESRGEHLLRCHAGLMKGHAPVWP